MQKNTIFNKKKDKTRLAFKKQTNKISSYVEATKNNLVLIFLLIN